MALLSGKAWKGNKYLTKQKEEKDELVVAYTGGFSYYGDDVVIHCNRKSLLYFKCSQHVHDC